MLKCIRLGLAVLWTCVAGLACNPCSDCGEGGGPSPQFAGTWVGTPAGTDDQSLDGVAQPQTQRSEDLTIAFDEQGRLTGLTFIGPTGWYWPRDVLQLSQVGDTGELQFLTHTYSMTQNVTLSEVTYSAEGVHIVCGGDFSVTNPGNTGQGTATQTVDVAIADGVLTATVRSGFDYQRGVRPGGPVDPSVVVHVVETFSASAPLNRQ